MKKTNDWIRLQEIFVSLEEQEKTLYDMDSAQLNYVINLAFKCPADLAVANAQSIVHLLFGAEIPPCESMQARSTKSLIKDVEFELPETDAYIEDNFPDPFFDKTVVNYYLPIGSTGKITIIDMFGQIIEEFELPEGENSFEITSKDWAPGVYSYTYFVNGSIIDYKKMVITQ
ncbi:MAG: T9SS type A sorting domain-containing protein [Bacteroidales bacterium]|nr:T9SS type A sorting domain-containing protein [Bacteroidales bacterium]